MIDNPDVQFGTVAEITIVDGGSIVTTTELIEKIKDHSVTRKMRKNIVRQMLLLVLL